MQYRFKIAALLLATAVLSACGGKDEKLDCEPDGFLELDFPFRSEEEPPDHRNESRGAEPEHPLGEAGR